MCQEKIWRDWVFLGSVVEEDVVSDSLEIMSNYLRVASSEVLIPLMTRCREFPEIAHLLWIYRRLGAEASEVEFFFKTSPRAVRVAFDEVRRAAGGGD